MAYQYKYKINLAVDQRYFPLSQNKVTKLNIQNNLTYTLSGYTYLFYNSILSRGCIFNSIAILIGLYVKKAKDFYSIKIYCCF